MLVVASDLAPPIPVICSLARIRPACVTVLQRASGVLMPQRPRLKTGVSIFVVRMSLWTSSS